MDSSSSSKRKLLPFVPDIAYEVQLVFIFTFAYIWSTAFLDDYNAPYPADPIEIAAIDKANWWRAIRSCVIFVGAFNILAPSTLIHFAPMQRFFNVVIIAIQMYFCFVIVMLNHRPEYGRKNIIQFLDPSLRVEITEGFHTYDDNCDLTLANLWDNIDHYFFIHWFDWFLASFVIRDVWVIHMWHILDEFVELSWQHILPHFRECWWDHILCDILLSNIPAVVVSMFV